MVKPDKYSESELIKKIENSANGKEVAKTKLETDEKVLARVTDGIYRLPGSAIRELISNAYDADAENVLIHTDVPRFESMTIRDDGNGMSIPTLVNLLGHIGGSAKRSDKGIALGVTSSEDKTLSPNKKRNLIGKIGIGLFSVAQLTRSFEIVTKQEGCDFYLKAKVKLYNYSEEYISNQEKKETGERGASFETGDVEIWVEKTDNINAHGTDIILHDIKTSARDLLKSVDIWGQASAEADSNEVRPGDFLDSSMLEAPKYHVGFLSGEDGYEFFDEENKKSPSLPWTREDKEEEKFGKLYQAILSHTAARVNPRLEVILDHYLYMIWTLALSIPLDYLGKHPFNHSLKDISNVYAISNKLKGQVEKIEHDDESVPFSKFVPFSSEYKTVDFNVTIDGIKLYRPIKYKDLPKSTSIVKDPILFLGSYFPDLSSMDIHDSAGELAFDAYILWSPKVIPKDHNGVLIRLHNSSGIMFDSTFLKHQIAEHTIKSQLTVEIFVNKGLDSALNIDRESFNISHPHYQIVMRWLHQAIRQVVHQFKAIKSKLNKESQEKGKSELVKKLSSHVDQRLEEYGYDPLEKPLLEIVEDITSQENTADFFRISKKDFIENTGILKSGTQRSHSVEAKAEALFQLLDAYGLLQNISAEKQNSLLADILKVLSTKI